MMDHLWLQLVALLAALPCLAAGQQQTGSQKKPKAYKEERRVTREGNDLMWCVLSLEEYAKCRHFAEAVERDQMETADVAFGSYYRHSFGACCQLKSDQKARVPFTSK